MERLIWIFFNLLVFGAFLFFGISLDQRMQKLEIGHGDPKYYNTFEHRLSHLEAYQRFMLEDIVRLMNKTGLWEEKEDDSAPKHHPD